MELAVIEGREYYWDGRYYGSAQGSEEHQLQAHTEV